MVRGGNIDGEIIGEYKVEKNGDIENWRVGEKGVKEVGGEMDIVNGEKKVVVIKENVKKKGEKKMVEK